jgi:hypothetical protein
MRIISFFSLLAILLVIFSYQAQAQTQQDTMYAYRTEVPVVIDGKADDACWASADWHAIDQVWIPFNANMKEGDFSGRFKLAWDSLYLYLLAEIVDDSLSDDHSNPMDSWWEDDCLEIFLDENRSKGNHECTYNAFAYHVSIFYDAIDMHTNCGGINLKDNLTVVMDTLENNTYIWEVAIKNYSGAFNPNNPEASRVYLHHNKLMGFSLAYCDNDETTGRENFIGSMRMTSATANESYKNADHFGNLLLIDPNATGTSVDLIQKDSGFNIYPNPVNDRLFVRFPEASAKALVSVYDQNGRLILQQAFSPGAALDVSALPEGIYQLTVQDGENRQVTSFVKQ